MRTRYLLSIFFFLHILSTYSSFENSPSGVARNSKLYVFTGRHSCRSRIQFTSQRMRCEKLFFKKKKKTPKTLKHHSKFLLFGTPFACGSVRQYCIQNNNCCTHKRTRIQCAINNFYLLQDQPCKKISILNVYKIEVPKLHIQYISIGYLHAQQSLLLRRYCNLRRGYRRVRISYVYLIWPKKIIFLNRTF